MNFLNDIKFALRLLVKQPASSALAILVMALGTGVAITMFTFVNGVMWSSLNLKAGDDLLIMEWEVDPKVRSNNRGMHILDFEVFDKEAQSFEGMTAFRWARFPFQNPSRDSLPKKYWGAMVSEGFFDTIGEKPLLGRSFLPEDFSRGQDDTIIISFALWQEQYGGNDDVIGAAAKIDGKLYTIVGVMRPGFKFPDEADYWIATGWSAEKAAGRNRFQKFVIGMLRDGTTIAQAKAEFATIAGRLAQEYPKTNENKRAIDFKSYTRWYLGMENRMRYQQGSGETFENTSYAMLLCSFLVLAVACANVFNVIMTRTAARTSELSIRNALGASRSHIVMQVLLDGVILTTLGALGGTLIAVWSLKLIWANFQQQRLMPYWWSMDMDGKVIGFVIGVVLVSALASSLIPGLRASRSSTTETLKDDSRTSSNLFIGGLSKIILSFQITVTGVLLFVSVLMLLIWVHMKTREYPFEPESILMTGLGVKGVGEEEDRNARYDFLERLKENLEAYPGLETFASGKLFASLTGVNPSTFTFDGEVYDTEESKPQAEIIYISEGFEKIFGVEPMVGRSFNALDTRESQRVCMVNKSFADHFWPNEDPIGKRILYYGTRTVVGVMPNLLPKPLPGENLQQAGYIKIYFSISQMYGGTFPILVRVQGDTHQWIEPMRRELHKIAPHLAFRNMGTLQELIDSRMARFDLIFGMFGVFGLAALIKAFIGLYAVMSFSTRQRYREFGIRMAMGADSGQIIFSVVKQGAILLTLCGVLGIALGHATLDDAQVVYWRP